MPNTQCYIIIMDLHNYASDSDTLPTIERKVCLIFFALDKAQAALQRLRSVDTGGRAIFDLQGADGTEGFSLHGRLGRVDMRVELRVGKVVDGDE
jgi:hypothetical protein